MRARRLWSPALAAVVLLVSAAVLMGWPASPAHARFADVSTHWALQPIDRMAQKGVVRGVSDVRFEPDRAVTRLEVVVMLVRLLGLEAQAQATTSLPSAFRSDEVVPAWARGYVAVAVDRGILAGSDLLYFRGAEAARRYEVAVWALRALGAQDEAERLSGTVVPFPDRLDIPVLWWGHVNAAVNRDLMGGRPDGTFGGAAAVTRAEMATILARMDDQVDNALDANEVRGTLKAVVTGATPAVTISRAVGGDVTVTLAEGASVYRDGRAATLSALRLGDTVALLLTTPAASIGAATRTTYVEAASPRSYTSGVIEAVTAGSLTLRLPTGARPAFGIAGADVRLGGFRAAAGSLVPGMPATVEARDDGAVVRVWADALAGEVGGSLAGVEYGDLAYVKLTVSTFLGPRERLFPAASDVTVTRDGTAATLAGLVPGEAAALTLAGGLVTRVVATSTVATVRGTVVSLTIAQQRVLTLADAAGAQTGYVLADNVAVVRANGSAGSLLELSPGQAVTLELRSNRVTKVTLRGFDRYDYVIGTVRHIQGTTVVVEADAGSAAVGVPAGGVATREVRLDTGSVVIRFESSGQGAAVTLIKVGDRVMAAGTYAGGVLTARMLTVIEAAE